MTADKKSEKVEFSPQEEIRNAVKVKLSEGNHQVKDVVVEKLVKVEHEKRVYFLEKGFKALSALEGDLKRNGKPDMSITTETGVVDGFSPDLTKKRRELKEKIDKHEQALSSAIKEKNWEPLKSLVESGSPKDNSPK